jgi:hypothetical protein
MIERGCFNYRWPLNEYRLELNAVEGGDQVNAGSGDGNEFEGPRRPKIAGTCVMFSFVKGGILYQIIRIEQAGSQDAIPLDQRAEFPTDCQIVLTIGSPVWFQSFRNEDRMEGKPVNPLGKVENLSSDRCLRYLDTSRGIGLEAKIWQLHPNDQSEPVKQLNLQVSPMAEDSGTHSGEIYPWPEIRAYNAVARFECARSGDTQDAVFMAAIRLTEAPDVRDLLDKGKGSEHSTVEWPSREDVSKKWYEKSWPELPTSEDIYKYIGASAQSDDATAAMWETIFLEREKKTDSSSDIAEVRLIGRCLEKILHVDTVLDEHPEYKDKRTQANPEGSESNPKDQESEPPSVGPPFGSASQQIAPDAKSQPKRAESGITSTKSTLRLALMGNIFHAPNIDLMALL